MREKAYVYFVVGIQEITMEKEESAMDPRIMQHDKKTSTQNYGPIAKSGQGSGLLIRQFRKDGAGSNPAGLI
jgi:hypothetical protein